MVRISGSRLALLCATGVVFGMTAAARAGFVSYTSRAAFDIDAPGTTPIDFQFTGTALEVTGTGSLMRPDPFQIPDTVVEIRGKTKTLYLLGPDFFDGSIVALTVNGPYNTADGTTYLKSGFLAEFTFGPAGATAFGIDVFAMLAPPLGTSVAVFVESTTGNPLFDDEIVLDSFVGFVSTDPIGLITFEWVGPSVEGENALGFDNLSFEGPTVCVDPCDDMDPCTENDLCVADVCQGTPIDCSSLDDDCNVGVCNAGVCETMTINGGGTCDDMDPCTENDTCTSGTCSGGPIDCSAFDDDCNTGVCNAGTCEAMNINNGGSCDDADACTVSDTCTGGTCDGSAVNCSAFDTQCLTYSCDAAGTPGNCATGTPNTGFVCDDGEVCTDTDVCTPGGVCSGTPIPGCGPTPPVPTVSQWGLLVLLLAGLSLGTIAFGHRSREESTR